MTCPHCTPADPNDCIPCAIRGQDKEAVRGDLAMAKEEIRRLREQVKLLTFQLEALRRHPEFHNLGGLAAALKEDTP